ncbi:MAG TPA: ABC transporter [Nitrospiraceae bacterium]|jgi:zinc transport system permease protein|nr:ABC transporter [Nitrospiraceae bacterium]
MGIGEFFGYGFIQRALLAGSCIALLCSLLGVLLVLRRLSLIGDGLAHVTFGSVALGLLLRLHPLSISIPVVMASSLGILKLTEKARLFGDAAIGIVSAVGIACGIILASVAGGFNVDLFSYLFGNILSISSGEVLTAMVVSSLAVVIIICFYNDLLSVSFDEEFAKTSGIDTSRINTILVLLTAVTVSLAMKVVGIMLTSALLILPAVTSLQIAKGFKHTMVLALVIAVISVVCGICISFLLNLPAGATVVLVNFLFFLGALTLNRVFLKK